MTSIKRRPIICKEKVLWAKVERWVKQSGGKKFDDISKIFEILQMKFPVVIYEGPEITLDGAIFFCETGDDKITIKISADSSIKVESEDRIRCTRRIATYKCDFSDDEIMKLYENNYISNIISMNTVISKVEGYYIEAIRYEDDKCFFCYILPTDMSNQQLYKILNVKRELLDEKFAKFFENSISIDDDMVKSIVGQLIGDDFIDNDLLIIVI